VFAEHAAEAHLEDLLKITSKELGEKFDDDKGNNLKHLLSMKAGLIY